MAQSFEDLTIWQDGQKYCLEIYALTANFPREEVYNITSQLRRASLSVPTNIAEAHGRRHYLDSINFLYNARGSAEEVRSLLYTAEKLSFISEKDRSVLNDKYIILIKQLNSFIKSIRLKKETS